MIWNKNNRRRQRSEPQIQEIQRHKQVTLVQNQIIKKIHQTKKSKKNFVCQHMQFPQSCEEFQPNTNYYDKFWKLFLLNQLTKNKIDELSQTVSSIEASTNLVQELLDQRQDILGLKQDKRKKVKTQIIYKQKNVKCPFSSCYKSYVSQITLHLHMKLKHNMANKGELQTYAENFWKWKQEKLKDHPGKFPLPPGYLQEYGTLTRRYPRQKYLILKDKHKWVEGVVDKDKACKLINKSNVHTKQNQSSLENNNKFDNNELQGQDQNKQSQNKLEFENNAQNENQNESQNEDQRFFQQSQQQEVKLEEN